MSSLFLVGACVSSPDFASGAAREELLDTLKAAAETARVDRTDSDRATIRILSLSGHGDPANMRLTADVKEARISDILEQILGTGAIAYRASTLPNTGRVSARFFDVPLPHALNHLLADTNTMVEVKQGLLIFIEQGWGRTASPSDDGSDSIEVSREILLEHLQASDVVSMLRDLFESDDIVDGAQLSVSSVAELNAVYITGRQSTVKEAIRLLRRADRPVPHVIISALVVNINSSSVESLGVSFADLADGSFSVSSIVPSTTGGNVVATFGELAGNTAQLTATLKFLAAQNLVHVLSRPYVATRSTMTAKIEIVDDQFVRVDTTEDDSSIIATDSITAGISMTITPIVMAGNAIRLDVSIEDSRFTVTAGDVLIAKERNAASTSMVVNSGQTIVIGGLNSKYRITEKSGTPWLRKLPIINLFTAEQDSLETQNELVVYLTPYIWVPSMDDPSPIRDMVAHDQADWLSIETLGN